jgi:hypothetical protein
MPSSRSPEVRLGQTVVIRPSERAADEDGKDSYEKIKRSGIAHGFSANPDRVGRCTEIWVVKDDGSEAVRARIIAVNEVPSTSGRRRCDIVFEVLDVYPAANIPPLIRDIKWTNNNVRYL